VPNQAETFVIPVLFRSSTLNLDAHWSRKGAEEPPMLSEPLRSSLKKTKVPVSVGLFPPTTTRIPVHAFPV
jgi:hypothetical protein